MWNVFGSDTACKVELVCHAGRDNEVIYLCQQWRDGMHTCEFGVPVDNILYWSVKKKEHFSWVQSVYEE